MAQIKQRSREGAGKEWRYKSFGLPEALITVHVVQYVTAYNH